jgi:hypothetical protein
LEIKNAEDPKKNQTKPHKSSERSKFTRNVLVSWRVDVNQFVCAFFTVNIYYYVPCRPLTLFKIKHTA